MSFSKAIKTRVKKAVKFIGDFEKRAIDMAFEKEYDCVICGHIHIPQQRTVTRRDRSVQYLNSGDWVESLTALEYADGAWTLYRHDPAVAVSEETHAAVSNASPSGLEAFRGMAGLRSYFAT